jgi:hypothetical protein
VPENTLIVTNSSVSRDPICGATNALVVMGLIDTGNGAAIMQGVV